jgi:hypothetical protein
MDQQNQGSDAGLDHVNRNAVRFDLPTGVHAAPFKCFEPQNAARRDVLRACREFGQELGFERFSRTVVPLAELYE